MIGNLAAIYSSRYSTRLHIGKEENHSNTQKTLFYINLPLQWTFLLLVKLLDLGHTPITVGFAFIYTMIFAVVTLAMLQLSKFMTNWFWTHGMDPDDHTLPYLSSIGDILGTLCLVIAFWCIQFVK